MIEKFFTSFHTKSVYTQKHEIIYYFLLLVSCELECTLIVLPGSFLHFLRETNVFFINDAMEQPTQDLQYYWPCYSGYHYFFN